MFPDNAVNLRWMRADGIINLRRMRAVCRKEFLHIVRDPRSLAVVVLAPIVMLILYGYAVTFDIRKIDLGVVDHDRSALSRRLADSFTSSGYFERYGAGGNDLAENIAALRVNRVRLIMVIPDRFAADIARGREVGVQMIADGSDANTAGIALGYAGGIVADFSQGLRSRALGRRGIGISDIPAVEPVPRIWYNPELKSTHFVVPGLIAIIMMMIAALLTSLTIVREKERGTFEQLISTPVKPLELMAGKIIPYALIGMADIALVVIAAIVWFGVPLRGDILTLFVFSLLFIFCALGLGLFVSSVAGNQQTAVVGMLFATMLPSVLLSGFIFPIDSMPYAVRAFTYLVPARYFLTALRSIFLKEGSGIAVLYPELIYLLAFGALFVALSLTRFKKHL